MANKSLADDTAALHARIADLEQYNATLKQDLQLLRTIIDTISSPIYAKDRDFRFIVANQQSPICLACSHRTCLANRYRTVRR
ncbi:MAG: hypothetical protein HC876_19245 [Chloroflexaceae bacterium]|nr:hypothetical protein [Chloroflexaceae bacterium]